jgi:hypothetical protein
MTMPSWKGVVPTTLAGHGMTVDEFATYVHGLQWRPWRPAFGVLHNTAAPTLAQHIAYQKTHTNGERFQNLREYYRDVQHWSAGPHLFVDNQFVWPFTPLNQSGVHSPGFNASGFGCEVFGDYDVEDDDTGDGYKAKRLAAAAFGVIYSALGIDPMNFKMHRDDPLTTHACPGKDLYQDRAGFIDMVRNFMGSGGEHDPDVPMPDKPPVPVDPGDGGDATEQMVSTRVDASGGLNLREAASTSAPIVAELRGGQKVAVFKTLMNGSTEWSFLWCRTPDQQTHTGWVASRYLD